ncbi:MAG TPA: helix-turn-helix domain-containing protein [Bacteroidota bacterium]
MIASRSTSSSCRVIISVFATEGTGLLAHGSRIEAEDIDLGAVGTGSGTTAVSGAGGLEERVRAVTEAEERKIILDALEKAGWNRTAAAQALNISRKTLFNKMQLYGINEQA